LLQYPQFTPPLNLVRVFCVFLALGKLGYGEVFSVQMLSVHSAKGIKRTPITKDLLCNSDSKEQAYILIKLHLLSE
jgi:hypothetical protein